MSVEACTQEDPSFDVDAMLDLARAELGGGLVRLQAPMKGELAIKQDCSTGDLELSRTDSEAPAQRVPLSDVPRALRTRVVALALSEFAANKRDIVDVLLERSESQAGAGASSQAGAGASSQAGAGASSQAGAGASSKAGAQKPKSSGEGKSWPKIDPAIRPKKIDPELLAEWRNPDKLGPPRTWTLGPEARLFIMAPSLALGFRSAFIRGRMEWSVFGLFQKRDHPLGRVRVGVFGLGWAGTVAQHQSRVNVALAIGGELGATWGKGQSVQPNVGTDYALRPYAALLMWFSLGWLMKERTVGRLQLGVGYAMGIEARVQDSTIASSAGPLVTLVLAFGSTR